MGFGGISMPELLIILVIVVVIFGTKRLKSIGTDLGGAVKGFRKAMADTENETRDPRQIGKPDADFTESTHTDSATRKSDHSGAA